MKRVFQLAGACIKKYSSQDYSTIIADLYQVTPGFVLREAEVTLIRDMWMLTPGFFEQDSELL